MTKYLTKITFLLLTLGAFLPFSSCDKSTSYSDLLRDEEHAVNWFLANHKVEVNLPEDNNFLTGEDAPFYKLDEEGNVYMQIINLGTSGTGWKEGDKVYFRFMRRNIESMYAGTDAVPEGNADDLSSSPTYFLYGNTVLQSTSQFGEGIQLPIKYLGYDSEVNLVLKSYQGFTSDQDNCIPYIYNIRYFQAIY